MVAKGVAESCKKYFRGGTGSLLINNEVKGIKEHVVSFYVGDLDPSKTFINILDETTLDILMDVLDAISDLISYFSKKEILLCSPKSILATGEEDLLPSSLTKMKGNEHD